ncbi:ABC transporter ATP-binding protein [Spiroplasma clarkii]|uniref:hypothetical protein n=1 Tax=Spiroplasma clarkii TaxID=2139 RepID=UPI000B563541|nr:hypothetical protein [Spiroplasma clarkii]ARU91415.1 ABC transporter ATP-binding protein [Spiroplasma clarkii]
MNKATKLVKKEPTDFKYRKAELKFIDKIITFNKYIKADLYPIFKSSKLLIDGNEVTAELSNKEQAKLKTMKKKYIQEEIKLMKLEERHLKKQARHNQS